MSIVSNSIINADAEARYLSPGELDQIKAFATGGQRRLRVAQILSEGRERIVKQAGSALFQRRPDVVSPGGNAYGDEMTATCLRDMDYYLRLVTYGVVAGDITPIEEIGVIGAKELYRSLGTGRWVIDPRLDTSRARDIRCGHGLIRSFKIGGW